MAGKSYDDVAREAWRWRDEAERRYKKTDDASADETQAIIAMSVAALTAITAEQAEENRKRR